MYSGINTLIVGLEIQEDSQEGHSQLFDRGKFNFVFHTKYCGR